MKGIPTTWSESDILKTLKLQNRVNHVRLVVKNTVQKDYCYIEFDSKEGAEEEVRIN
jgi:RNA recognition motif-containing protein